MFFREKNFIAIFKIAAHPGKCVIKDKVLSPGQSIKHPVMACAQFICDNAQGMATIEAWVISLYISYVT